MYELDSIEAINIDQVVTATDRILLRGAVTGRRVAGSIRDRAEFDFDGDSETAFYFMDGFEGGVGRFQEIFIEPADLGFRFK